MPRQKKCNASWAANLHGQKNLCIHIPPPAEGTQPVIPQDPTETGAPVGSLNDLEEGAVFLEPNPEDVDELEPTPEVQEEMDIVGDLAHVGRFEEVMKRAQIVLARRDEEARKRKRPQRYTGGSARTQRRREQTRRALEESCRVAQHYTLLTPNV
jgi:hypothetical protein